MNGRVPLLLDSAIIFEVDDFSQLAMKKEFLQLLQIMVIINKKQ